MKRQCGYRKQGGVYLTVVGSTLLTLSVLGQASRAAPGVPTNRSLS